MNELEKLNVHYLVEAEKKKTIKTLTDIVILASLMVLHTQYGHGKKRLNRFIKHYENQFACLNAKTVNIKDFIKFFRDMGVKI